MKKLFFVLGMAGALLAPGMVLAQAGSGYTFQTTGTTQYLHDVSCADNHTCWAVGTSATFSRATMIKTTDGGQTWVPLSPGVSYPLLGVHFTNRTTGFAVGSSRNILKTTDGGTTWRVIPTDAEEGLTIWDVDCSSSGTACVATGFDEQILQSSNGGDTWTKRRGATARTATSDTTNFDRVAFASDTRVIVAGGAGKIFVSNDAGGTWAEKSRGLTAEYFSIDCPDANTCFAGGASGELVKTTDGGNTWNRLYFMTPTVGIRGIHFIDSLTGWADGGAFWKTTDGGVTWQQLETFSNLPILRGQSFVGSEGWIAGDNGTMIKIGSASGSDNTGSVTPVTDNNSTIQAPTPPTLASRPPRGTSEDNATKRKQRMEIQSKLKEIQQARKEGRQDKLKELQGQFQKEQEALKTEFKEKKKPSIPGKQESKTSAPENKQGGQTGQGVSIRVAVNGYPKTMDLIPNAFINMYAVTPVAPGIYDGELLVNQKTGPDGAGVFFTVLPGQKVDFVGFRNADNATAATHWIFSSPPYKNFSAEDFIAERLCQINFLDDTAKLQSNGTDSCASASRDSNYMTYPAMDEQWEKNKNTPQKGSEESKQEIKQEVKEEKKVQQGEMKKEMKQKEEKKPAPASNGALPDLTVTSIDNTNNLLTIKITNQGSADVTTNQGRTFIWIDGDQRWVYLWATLDDKNFMKAGGASLLQPQALAGAHDVKVCVDHLNAVPESDETNNCLGVHLGSEKKQENMEQKQPVQKQEMKQNVQEQPIKKDEKIEQKIEQKTESRPDSKPETKKEGIKKEEPKVKPEEIKPQQEMQKEAPKEDQPVYKEEPKKETKVAEAGLEILRLSDKGMCTVQASAWNTNAFVGHYRIHATGEDMVINRLTVFNDLTGRFDKPESTAVIPAFAIYSPGSLVAPQALVNGSATFSGLRWTIPKDTDIFFDLRADVSGTTNFGPGLNGKTFRLGIQDTDNSANTLQVIGKTSGMNFSVGSGVTITNGDPAVCTVNADK